MKSDAGLRLAVTARACQFSSAVADLCQRVQPLVLEDTLVTEQSVAECAIEQPFDALLDFMPASKKNDEGSGLTLQFVQQPHWKPVRWSFTDASWLKRLQHASRQQETLLKLAGKNLSQMQIVDATGGRGYDAMLLAKAGARVTVCERDPLIYTLLQDAQLRANQHALLSPILSRMQWFCIDSVEYLQQVIKNHQLPDIVYCDPMFPPRASHALNQKNLLALQQWLGHGETNHFNLLIKQALCSARQRVVLKYAAKQTLPAAIKADFSHAGRGHNWYVFLTENQMMVSE